MSTVAVTATVEASNVPPRVRLDVVDSGTPELFAATVTRLDPDGRVVPVRTTDGGPLILSTSGATRVGLVYDYEMPYGAPVTYSTLESPGVSSTPVTVDEESVWLIHPGVPALSMPVSVAAFGGRVRRVNRGVFDVMGRSAPVIQTDGARKAHASSVQIQTFTVDELASLEALTADAGTLLLNVPTGLGWGVSTSYISVGDIAEDRLIDYAAEPRRYVTLPYQVVDRPTGGTQSERTYVDLLDFATYAELQGAYATYADLLAGP